MTSAAPATLPLHTAVRGNVFVTGPWRGDTVGVGKSCAAQKSSFRGQAVASGVQLGNQAATVGVLFGVVGSGWTAKDTATP